MTQERRVPGLWRAAGVLVAATASVPASSGCINFLDAEAEERYSATLSTASGSVTAVAANLVPGGSGSKTAVFPPSVYVLDTQRSPLMRLNSLRLTVTRRDVDQDGTIECRVTIDGEASPAGWFAQGNFNGRDGQEVRARLANTEGGTTDLVWPFEEVLAPTCGVSGEPFTLVHVEESDCFDAVNRAELLLGASHAYRRCTP